MTAPSFETLFAARPVFLAPMEDVSDAAFRRVCRARGASVCFTEFVQVDQLVAGELAARRKLVLADDDAPTAVQIYGSDPENLARAAAIAEQARPAWLDINCGCWVPRVAHKGAGAGWLRDPDAMVAMVARVVRACSLPVTVKTRIGWGPESHMPIVDLARRLEDAGVRAITVHCRTARMGHSGSADWSWAARAQAVVKIPVVVNGDVVSASTARRALEQTGCAAVMIGRRAMEHPWVFREARALLDTGVGLPKPTRAERFALAREYLAGCVLERGERSGMRHARKLVPGFLKGVAGARENLATVVACDRWDDALEALEVWESALARGEYEACAAPEFSDAE